MAAPDSVAVVTSWPEAALPVYGDRWLQGFTRHAGLRLHFMYEEAILKDPAVRAFREREADAETSSGCFRRGALKWSWKVFAIHDAMSVTLARPVHPRDMTEWLIWIDGDVEFTREWDREFLDAITPDDADLVFLGRPWAYASETGFVAYRIGNPRVRRLIRAMRATYLDGSFRDLENWGDAAVLDNCRRNQEIHGGEAPLRELDLVAELDLGQDDFEQGGLHVWPATILGRYMTHQKGPARKREAYGETTL